MSVWAIEFVLGVFNWIDTTLCDECGDWKGKLWIKSKTFRQMIYLFLNGLIFYGWDTSVSITLYTFVKCTY